MIIITETAIARIKEMLNEEEEQGLKLRIGVKGGGCSGLSYGMGFDKEEQDNDQKLDYDGVEVLVDEESAPVLKGVVIDYKQNMMGGGFTIENPNAIASCGCGSSFRTAENAGKPEEC